MAVADLISSGALVDQANYVSPVQQKDFIQVYNMYMHVHTDHAILYEPALTHR